jgi:hypothetical protein
MKTNSGCIPIRRVKQPQKYPLEIAVVHCEAATYECQVILEAGPGEVAVSYGPAGPKEWSPHQQIPSHWIPLFLLPKEILLDVRIRYNPSPTAYIDEIHRFAFDCPRLLYFIPDYVGV